MFPPCSNFLQLNATFYMMIIVQCGDIQHTWQEPVSVEEVHQHFGTRGKVMKNVDGKDIQLDPNGSWVLMSSGLYRLLPEEAADEPTNPTADDDPTADDECICRVCREGDATEELHHPCRYRPTYSSKSENTAGSPSLFPVVVCACPTFSSWLQVQRLHQVGPRELLVVVGIAFEFNEM